MNNNVTKTKLLKGLSIVLFILAAVTVIPHRGAASPSLLGYRSMCPFAPVSTGIALYGAFMIRRYFHTPATGRK
jgi:hypothetical protein